MVDESIKDTTLPDTAQIRDALLKPMDRSTACNIKISKFGDTQPSKDTNEGYEMNQTEPPDGGLRAWLVVLSAFLLNSILFGIINTYGIIYLTLQERMTISGDTDSSSKAGN